MNYHLRRIGQPRTTPECVDLMCIRHQVTFIGRSLPKNDNQHYKICSSNFEQNVIISRRHARILLQDDTKVCQIYDDSMNGIYINDIKIDGSASLNEGDCVTFGHLQGQTITPGTKVRQPDSEYQFVFERCHCFSVSQTTAEDEKKDLLSVKNEDFANYFNADVCVMTNSNVSPMFEDVSATSVASTYIEILPDTKQAMKDSPEADRTIVVASVIKHESAGDGHSAANRSWDSSVFCNKSDASEVMSSHSTVVNATTNCGQRKSEIPLPEPLFILKTEKLSPCKSVSDQLFQPIIASVESLKTEKLSENCSSSTVRCFEIATTGDVNRAPASLPKAKGSSLVSLRHLSSFAEPVNDPLQPNSAECRQPTMVQQELTTMLSDDKKDGNTVLDNISDNVFKIPRKVAPIVSEQPNSKNVHPSKNFDFESSSKIQIKHELPSAICTDTVSKAGNATLDNNSNSAFKIPKLQVKMPDQPCYKSATHSGDTDTSCKFTRGPLSETAEGCTSVRKVSPGKEVNSTVTYVGKKADFKEKQKTLENECAVPSYNSGNKCSNPSDRKRSISDGHADADGDAKNVVPSKKSRNATDYNETVVQLQKSKQGLSCDRSNASEDSGNKVQKAYAAEFGQRRVQNGRASLDGRISSKASVSDVSWTDLNRKRSQSHSVKVQKDAVTAERIASGIESRQESNNGTNASKQQNTSTFSPADAKDLYHKLRGILNTKVCADSKSKEPSATTRTVIATKMSDKDKSCLESEASPSPACQPSSVPRSCIKTAKISAASAPNGDAKVGRKFEQRQQPSNDVKRCKEAVHRRAEPLPARTDPELTAKSAAVPDIRQVDQKCARFEDKHTSGNSSRVISSRDPRQHRVTFSDKNPADSSAVQNVNKRVKKDGNPSIIELAKNPKPALTPELLRNGWRSCWSDKKGRWYFFNGKSKASVWEMPS